MLFSIHELMLKRNKHRPKKIIIIQLWPIVCCLLKTAVSPYIELFKICFPKVLINVSRTTKRCIGVSYTGCSSVNALLENLEN